MFLTPIVIYVYVQGVSLIETEIEYNGCCRIRVSSLT